MKRFVMCVLCLVTMGISSQVKAQDVFPEYEKSSKRLYIPIEQIQLGYQEDVKNEVGFNFSYNVNGQIFMNPADGHIQTIAEGFSGITDKSTPWKTLTELLAAYQRTDADAVKALYTPDSQTAINDLLSDPEVAVRFTRYMQAIQGLDVLLGFDYRDGFFTIVKTQYNDATSELVSFYFVPNGSGYWLKAATFDEAITANISLFLQTGHSVEELEAPKHGLSVEKTGTGNGTVNGSGIDCGDDCVEVFVEGTAVWLKAEADEYSTFEGWLVDGEALKDQLVIKEDTVVTAMFSKIPPKEHTLSIEKIGIGDGSVTDSETACETPDCLEVFSIYADSEEAPVVESGSIAAKVAASCTSKARQST